MLDRAEEEADTPMPGYTHLQRAIPVTLGHHLLAWVEMLERDRARFTFAAGQARPSPLGAGALAGSTLPLPPPPDAMRNSLDAVSDRDFALDYLYAAAVLFTHLSRIGEELVLWTASEFGFARLPEDAATGSSMMPQKLNPDVAELARGKAGTAIGRLTGLLAVVKGLPLAYDRDLQEDKPPVFAARRDVAGALGALAVLVERPRVRPRAPRGRVRRPAAARDRRGGGAGTRGRAVPRRARAGRGDRARGHLRPRASDNSSLGSARDRRARRGGGCEGALVVTVPAARASDKLSLAAEPARPRRGRLVSTPALAGRDLLRIADLSAAEVETILDTADELKTTPRQLLPGRTLGLFFGQPSTRTRISFSVAMAQLGGTPITLLPSEMQLSRGESLEDTSQVLSRYLDALAIRTLSHSELEAWAEASTIPVINALTEAEHPCQALADAMTIRERLGALAGVRVAWVGDGTNVLVSLAWLASLVGMEVVAACPEGYEPAEGTPVELIPDPREAARGADVLITDIWVSLGQEATRGQRLRELEPYRLDESLLALASPDAIVLHCLPAHPGEEISPGVLYGEQSAVWDEAENRLHAQKALLALVIA